MRSGFFQFIRYATLLLVCCANASARAQSVAEAEAALHSATDFFVNRVATEGGYLWRYSADLKKAEGEGAVDRQTVWIQPPGTPSVGMAFLEAYLLTEEPYLLDAACAAGTCLVNGQLHSGGWDYRIEFDPARRKRYAYRVDPPRPKARNVTTLDDNTTQAALRFLIRLDATLAMKDAKVHDAVRFALGKLLSAQYPNGAWPQRFDAPPKAAEHPVEKASYPDDWPRVWPAKKYKTYYTFNDNAIADTIDVMFIAGRVYNEPTYRAAAEKAGDFILLAQMPEPQPGWAQQYNERMQPAWARKFEPPAITGGEARGILQTLLRMYQETGQDKYLEPIPRALAYYRKSRLPGGGLARFYELQTNRPLYFTRAYELTYDDSDLPTHYGFKIGDWTDAVARQFEQVRSTPPKDDRPASSSPTGRPVVASPRLTKTLQQQAARAIASLDQRSAWVERGSLKYHGPDDNTDEIIDSRTFARNLLTLASFVAASRDRR